MNRKQRKAKRLRATQHTKSQAHDWKKYDTPCSDVEGAMAEEAVSDFDQLLSKHNKVTAQAQMTQRMVGRVFMVASVIALICLVTAWIK